MSFIHIIVFYFVGFFLPAVVLGYSKECAFNQTNFAPVGTIAFFQVNVTRNQPFLRVYFSKTSGSSRGRILHAYIHGHEIDPRFTDQRINISSQQYSEDVLDIRISLINVSMNDNGTYTLSYDHTFCFILYVIEIKTEPSNVREENESVLVYEHPHASLIKRPLANATMTWLLDGQSVNQTASFVQQDGHIWIPSVGRGLDEKNVTYRAIEDDGRIIEINATLRVKYGPSHPLTLVPRKSHYNLLNGETLPDITCTSECSPPCKFSWGNNGEGNILSLGAVTTKDTGEYSCTATKADGGTVEQTVSVFVMDVVVSDNFHFTAAIACLATFQALTILSMGMCSFFIYKREVPSCCHQVLELVSKNKSDNNKVTFSASPVQGSENECYEELRPGTKSTGNSYGEVNLAIAGDEAQYPADIYENTNTSN